MTDTFFASAYRRPPADAERIAVALEAVPHLREIIEAAPQMTAIVGMDRQILMCNAAFAAVLPETRRGLLLQLRPGEVVNCAEAQAAPGGCGTGANCRWCGAVLAILDAQEGRHSVRECIIHVKDEHGDPELLQFRVDAVPMHLAGEAVTWMSVLDIGDVQMQRLMERAFIHDLLNTASNIWQIVDLYRTADDAERASLVDDLDTVSRQLVDEIHYQRDYIAAEHGVHVRELQPVVPSTVFSMLEAAYRSSRLTAGRQLHFDMGALGDTAFSSSATMLARVLGNLVRNALEASRPGEEIRVWCEPSGTAGIVFHVHNNGVIPQEVQAHLFRRFRSTKGANRGIGTYAARVLVEKVLGGRITFTSDAAGGTTFSIHIEDAVLPPQ